MLREEFEQRTGYYPSVDEYSVIEEFYTEYDGDKDLFCKAYKKNKDFLAENIRAEVNRRHFKSVQESEKVVKELNEKIEKLEENLYREQEWKPHEDKDNVSQSDYENLRDASITEKLSDEKARDILYGWFGFAEEKIIILRSVPKYEVNRHRLLNQIGEIERIPLYAASDWNYIRFDCGGMCWELKDGMINAFLH